MSPKQKVAHFWVVIKRKTTRIAQMRNEEMIENAQSS